MTQYRMRHTVTVSHFETKITNKMYKTQVGTLLAKV